MYVAGILAQFPAHLSYGFHERRTLDVADGASDFGDDEVIFAVCRRQAYAPFDFVGDVRHYLYGLSEIVATAFAVDDGFVDASCSDGIVACGVDAGKAFVVSEVEVRLHAIVRHVAFAMFVGVECSGVDVDVGVELLDGDTVSSGLEQFADGGGNDAFSKGGNYAARYEYEFW